MSGVGGFIFDSLTLDGKNVVPLRYRHPNIFTQPAMNTSGRTATPFYQMLQKVELERAKRRQRLQEEQEQLMDNFNLFEGEFNKRGNDLTNQEDELWVDKYRPRKFTELISMDPNCLTVLQWASQWNQHIKGPIPAPENRILLIHGSAGLGKSTLAMVVAQTAKFQPVEINASDERTGNVVISKISAACTSDSMLTGRRPNLIIIDEIDGAVSGSGDLNLINYLVRIASSVNRPIICICNDLYAAPLKPLRPLVQIITLSRPTPTQLATRLKEICKEEGVLVDGKALVELCDLMECDIRASLHALQFITRRRSKEKGVKCASLNAEGIERLLTGLKDTTKSTFSLYEAILGKRKDNNRSLRQTSLISLLQDHGEVEKLSGGIYELLPQCKYHDDTRYSKSAKVLDTLGLVDQFQGTDYASYLFLSIHQTISSPLTQIKSFPKSQYQLHLSSQRNAEIMRTFLRGLNAQTASLLGRRNALLYRVPFLVHQINNTNFRITNPQLLREHERAKLTQIANILLQNGLTFKQTLVQSGFYEFILDPAIDQILPSQCSGKSLDTHQNAVRQMIANEIDLLKIMKIQSGRNKKLKSADGKTSMGSSSNRAAEYVKAYESVASPTTLPPIKTTTEKLRIKRDFFGRPINVPSTIVTPSHPTPAAPSVTPIKIWYRFNEGFTNAIRRPIKIKDLFYSTN